MSGGQIVALVFGMLLLPVGGGPLVFGISAAHLHNGIFAALFLIPAAVILGLASLLIWIAFRKEHSAPMGGARITALILGLLLLLPGAAGVFLGGIFAYSHFNYALLPLALGTLVLALFLLSAAYRKRAQRGTPCS